MENPFSELGKMNNAKLAILVGEIIVALLFVAFFTNAELASSRNLGLLVKKPISRFLIVAIIVIITMYNISIGFMLGLVYLSMLFRSSTYESFEADDYEEEEEEEKESEIEEDIDDVERVDDDEKKYDEDLKGVKIRDET